MFYFSKVNYIKTLHLLKKKVLSTYLCMSSILLYCPYPGTQEKDGHFLLSSYLICFSIPYKMTNAGVKGENVQFMFKFNYNSHILYM